METTAIKEHKNVCFKCLDIIDGGTLNIAISDMGYGSKFDGIDTRIQLCGECLRKTPLEWWNLEIEYDKSDFESYKYDDEIFDYVVSLPMSSKELFFNTLNSNRTLQMEQQDWIDHELGILPKDKMSMYGLVFNYNQFIKHLTAIDNYDIVYNERRERK